jgi:predicted nucleic acid-binding protein
MLLVDSSTWIDFFNGKATPETLYLRDQADRSRIVIGDLILCEVLQGFRSDRDYEEARALLAGFRSFDLIGQDIALQAARNYRALRKRGITVRKTIDVLIATSCIVHGMTLLHSDRDFDPFEQYLGLQALHPASLPPE